MSLPVRPSEVTDYIRCPRLWYYKHVEGWQAPPAAWTPWQLMGSAVHAGLKERWSGRPAFASLATRQAIDSGWPPTAPPEFSREAHEALALKVLDKVLAWIAREMADAEPILVEHTLREDGCTPDLVTREPIGLVVTDWKTSWNVDPDRVRYRLEGLDRTHQFLDYAWSVGQHLNEPVALVRKVVIVGSPRIIVRDATWQPTPAALEQWLTGARQMWEDMAKMKSGEAVAWQNTNGCTQYGVKYPCTYWDACWTCHGDREKMAQFLVRTEGRRDG